MTEFFYLKVEYLLKKLLAWLDKNGLASYDIADALQSPALGSLTSRSWLAQRLAIQFVRKFPINIRPILGIRHHLSSQTLALLCSSHAWQYFGGWKDMTDQNVREVADALIRDRLRDGDNYIWGLKLYFSTRFVQANPTTPNLFQTCNAIHCLLDVYQAIGDTYFADVAKKAIETCSEELGIVKANKGRYCRYYPGMDTPVYNVNALFAAACLRLSCLGIGDIDINRERSKDLLAFVLSGQRSDGSWPYAADKVGQWTDGYHTGYILEALGYFLRSPLVKLARDALKAGLVFFENNLVDPDACPKHFANSRYPIDVQNCAQAIQTTARLLPLFESKNTLLQRMIKVVVKQLYIDDGENAGYFAANRGRWFTNKIPYIRWGQAPMVLALTHAWNALKNNVTFFNLTGGGDRNAHSRNT